MDVQMSTVALLDRANYGIKYLKLKEFQVPTNIPTQTATRKWLSETANIFIEITHLFGTNSVYFSVEVFNALDSPRVSVIYKSPLKDSFRSYEEGIEKGIEEALEYLIVNGDIKQ